MQVSARDAPGLANLADQLTGFNQFVSGNIKIIEMRVARNNALPVVNKNGFATDGHLARIQNPACPWRVNIQAHDHHRKIKASMVALILSAVV